MFKKVLFFVILFGIACLTLSNTAFCADAWDPQDNTGGGGTVIVPTQITQSHGPHTLDATDLYDWFKIDMIAGYTYHFDTTGGTGDNYGELYSGPSTTSARVAYNDDSGGAAQFSFNYTAADSQTYFLRIRAYSIGNPWSGSLNYSYRITSSSPTLSWTGETNYTDKGVFPTIGSTTTVFTYRVKYTDADNDPPSGGYPVICIRKGGIWYLFTSMAQVDPADTTYTDGKLYTFSTTLYSGTDYTYYFAAYDSYNAPATGMATVSQDAPDVFDLIIQGYVEDSNGAGMSDVTVNLTGTTESVYITTATGYYIFYCNALGNYTITPFKLNYKFNPVSKSSSSILGNITNWDFTGIEAYYIKGYVRDSAGRGISSARVNLTGTETRPEIVTDTDGYYAFTYLSSGTYTVTVKKTNWIISPSSITVSLSPNVNNANFSGTYTQETTKIDIPIGKENRPVQVEMPNPADIKIILPESAKERRGVVNPDKGDEVAIVFKPDKKPEEYINQKFTIRIFTLLGEIVDTFEKTPQTADDTWTKWRPQDLASGIYLVHVEGPGVKIFKKVAIVR